MGRVNVEADTVFPHLRTLSHIVSVESESSLDKPRQCGDLYRYVTGQITTLNTDFTVCLETSIQTVLLVPVSKRRSRPVYHKSCCFLTQTGCCWLSPFPPLASLCRRWQHFIKTAVHPHIGAIKFLIHQHLYIFLHIFTSTFSKCHPIQMKEYLTDLEYLQFDKELWRFAGG